MIVHDFHIVGVAVCPRKADAVLLVDANTVLSLPIALQRFQVIAGQGGQVPQVLRFVERRQFSLGYPFNGSIFPAKLIVEELLSFGVPKRVEHIYSV